MKVRFGIDNLGVVSGNPILKLIAPHVAVFKFQSVSDSQYSSLLALAEILRAVAAANGNDKLASNIVCEKA